MEIIDEIIIQNSNIYDHYSVHSPLLASERSERDTYRGNTIENRGCQFIYLLASERSERDTYRGNTIENRGCLFIYLFICIYVWTYVCHFVL